MTAVLEGMEGCDNYLVTKNPWSKEGKARENTVFSDEEIKNIEDILAD